MILGGVQKGGGSELKKPPHYRPQNKSLVTKERRDSNPHHPTEKPGNSGPGTPSTSPARCLLKKQEREHNADTKKVQKKKLNGLRERLH